MFHKLSRASFLFSQLMQIYKMLRKIWEIFEQNSYEYNFRGSYLKKFRENFK